MTPEEKVDYRLSKIEALLRELRKMLLKMATQLGLKVT
jgi:hypothetical protein